ncbi:hypothetical protein [Streptomyces lydicus]|nr:hypothetical protein [Streptomyces lydicus]
MSAADGDRHFPVPGASRIVASYGVAQRREKEAKEEKRNLRKKR